MCRRANRRISHDAVTGLPTERSYGRPRPSSSRMVESTLGIGTLPPQAGVYVPRRLSQVYGSVTSRGKASAMSSFPLFTWLVSCHLGALFDHGFALAYGGRLGRASCRPRQAPAWWPWIGMVALDCGQADSLPRTGGRQVVAMSAAVCGPRPQVTPGSGVIDHHIDDYIARARLKPAAGE